MRFRSAPPARRASSVPLRTRPKHYGEIADLIFFWVEVSIYLTCPPSFLWPI